MNFIRDVPQEDEKPISTNQNNKPRKPKPTINLPQIPPKKPRTQTLTSGDEHSSFKPESILPSSAKSLSNHLNRQNAPRAKMCELCHDPVCDGVVIKPCSHMFCEECWAGWKAMRQQEQEKAHYKRLLQEGKLPCPQCWTIVKTVSVSVPRLYGLTDRGEAEPVFKDECCDLKEMLNSSDL